MSEVLPLGNGLALMRHNIGDQLCDLLLERAPLLLLEILRHLLILSVHVLELLDIDGLAVLVLPEYLLRDLLPLLVLVELYEPLHDNPDDQDVHEVVCHQQVYHEKDTRYVRIVRVLQHVHDLVPILES